MAADTSSKSPADPTFRSYSSQQAAGYASARKPYPPALIKFLLDHHRATGGETGVLLDVGCGPGNATRDLAPHFDVAFGADPGEAMIQTATELGGTTATGAPIQYRVCSAEELDTIKEIEHGSVDMITAATAVHWFDMSKFWPAAAKLVKPGGTVAFWTLFGTHYNPGKNSNAAKLQEIWTRFTETVLRPYVTPGNRLAHSGYVGLEMPWDNTETVALFEKDTFLRRRWDADDESSDNMDMFREAAQLKWSLKEIEAMAQTMSPVTRWREAHPDLAGTDKDCVKVILREIREALGVPEGGESNATLHGGFAIVLLCVKRAK